MRNPFKKTPPAETSWQLKQRAAAPGRYYGDGGTIHSTRHLHVETYDGAVVAVWFRCQMLPFQQVNVTEARARDLTADNPDYLPALTGVEVVDYQ